jgi:hypothetical protein
VQPPAEEVAAAREVGSTTKPSGTETCALFAEWSELPRFISEIA